MQMIETTVPLIDSSNQISAEIGLRAFMSGTNIRIEVVAGPLSGADFSGVDFFWTLAELRRRFEELGLRPALKGAVKWVFPGGLLGETSLGRIAVRFNADGEVIGNDDIFDRATPSEFGDILYFDQHYAFRRSLKDAKIKRR